MCRSFSVFCSCFSACFSTGNRSRLLMRLIPILFLLGLTGCSPFGSLFSREPEIHVPQGKCAELRAPVRLAVWSHDKDGNPVKGYVKAYAGYLVAPATPTAPEFKTSEVK